MFPQVSWLKIIISKNWDTDKSTDNNGINIFLTLENPCTFLLAKERAWKRIFNAIIAKSYRKTNYAIQNNSKLAV